MPTSAQSISRRLRNAPSKTRVGSEEEPPPKRVRVDRPNDSPVSSPVKGPLKQSAGENSPSFVAKTFYGLKKSQLIKENVPLAAERNKSATGKSTDMPGPEPKSNTGSNTVMCPRSYLDKLMLEKVELSPVKQAVLQTCTLAEFRKMYIVEYKELEEEIKRKNGRVTRQKSQILSKEMEENLDSEDCFYSDSSDDEVSFKIHDRDLDCRTGDHISLETVIELVAGSYNDEAMNENCRAPPKKNPNRVAVRDKTTVVYGKGCITGSITRQADKGGHDVRRDSPTPDDEESDEINTLCQVNSNKDSSQKLSTPPSSERKFFKTRSPLDSTKRGGVVLGKGFNWKFMPKTSKTKGDKKKLAYQKREPGSVSLKTKQVSVAPILPFYEKSIRKQKQSVEEAMSPALGFTFAPGFLSPEKGRSEQSTNDMPESSENENFDLNKSNCCTYGSMAPKYTGAENSSDIESPFELVGSPLSENTSHLTGHPQPKIRLRKDGSSDQFSDRGGTSEKESHVSTPTHKLFPIFQQRSSRVAVANKKQSLATQPSDASPVSSSSKLPKDNSNSQMIIDAGQKKFGVTQCPECSMVYCHADPVDEASHAKFHKQLLEVLKFPGWKKERVVQEYPEDLGRVILIMHDDTKYAKRKVEEVNQIMGRELGFPDAASAPYHPHHKVFFYVQDKQITGCCVAEPVHEGYRIIPGDLDNSQESGQRPWCCTSVPEPICVGISRLWVAPGKRKHGVATKLLDCVRQWFNYGSLIPKHKVAFSDPTPDGRRFAHKYMGTPTFLVYKYNYG